MLSAEFAEREVMVNITNVPVILFDFPPNVILWVLFGINEGWALWNHLSEGGSLWNHLSEGGYSLESPQ